MARETWVEMELNGPADQALGFVEGYRAARPGAGPIWVAGLENVDLDGFLNALRSRLKMERHIILGREMAEVFRDAISRSRLLDLEVGEVKAIDHAELPFRFECYSRQEGEAIRRLVEEDLPEDVRLEGYEVKEIVREDARGVELYGPVHDYILRGTGRYVGSVPGIITMSRRLKDQSFVHPGKVELTYTT